MHPLGLPSLPKVVATLAEQEAKNTANAVDRTGCRKMEEIVNPEIALRAGVPITVLAATPQMDAENRIALRMDETTETMCVSASSACSQARSM